MSTGTLRLLFVSACYAYVVATVVPTSHGIAAARRSHLRERRMTGVSSGGTRRSVRFELRRRLLLQQVTDPLGQIHKSLLPDLSSSARLQNKSDAVPHAGMDIEISGASTALVEKRRVPDSEGGEISVDIDKVQISKPNLSDSSVASFPELLHQSRTRAKTDTPQGIERFLPSGNQQISSQESVPFSVNISGIRYFGGAMSYTHELQSTRICHVMNACVRADGTLVLPQWMRRLEEMLSFQCGAKHLEFSLPDNEPPLQLQRMDLIGLTYPRPSMSGFVEDFMPQTMVFDALGGGRILRKRCHSRSGGACEGFPDINRQVQPAVLLDPRIKLLNKSKSWVRQFVSLLTAETKIPKAKVLFPSDIFSKTVTAEMKCFRSAYFTRSPHNRAVITADHLQALHLFKIRKVRKQARKVLIESSIRDEGEAKVQRLCGINVTIANRKLLDGDQDQVVGRYIPNIPQLRRAIAERAKAIPGLKIHVSALTMEGKSIIWQMNAMQRTDILVAGHGSMLTNMIFLRENSTAVELLPFAYYPKTYEKMARTTAHVNYDSYIAHPDTKAFIACMESMYGSTHVAYPKVAALLRKYKMAAEKYFASDSTHTITLHNLMDGEMQAKAKTCAQMQRLDTDASNFATSIVRIARLRCGYPRPK